MKYLLVVFAFLCLVGNAEATITLVQHGQIDRGTGTNTFSFGSAVTSGNLLVVFFNLESGTGTPTFTGSSPCNGTWGPSVFVSNATLSSTAGFTYTKATGSGTCTVTQSGVGGSVSWAWAEYSASAGWAATVLDQSIAQSAPGTPTTFTSSTLTTTVNEEVLVYGCRVQSALTGTSAGFTTETNNSSAQWISLVDRVVSSSGGYAATCTVASAEFIDVAFGTFKTTTAGGGTPIKKKVTNSKLQKNTGNNKLQKG